MPTYRKQIAQEGARQPSKKTLLPGPKAQESQSITDVAGLLHKEQDIGRLVRRYSHDDETMAEKVFSLEVGPTMEALLRQEDTDKDKRITIDDEGPKSFWLGKIEFKAAEQFQVQGTYALANLLQELYFAKKNGLPSIHLELSQLTEDPVHRLSRFIRTRWWDHLTRKMDAGGVKAVTFDDKTLNDRPRIYIPPGAPEQYAYYSKIAQDEPAMNLDVQWLPEGEFTGEFIKSINFKPGILALEMDFPKDKVSGEKEPIALPFIVPGDRFNELYNWDSYFCAIGMVDSHPYLVKSILRNFIFEIKHYGKILNANRSYYLGRAQPPFLTDLALRVYESSKLETDAKDILRQAILAAMKEYHNWWMSEPRLDPESGLSRYHPTGSGSPPECDDKEFAHILNPYAEKHNMTLSDFRTAYDAGTIAEPALDAFFLHDRAVRESGHDTSNRLENVCADLATIDLNTLLYRYETDIAFCIRTLFADALPVPAAFCAPGQQADHLESSATWDRRARARKARIDKYCWNEDAGMYFDYNTATHTQQAYESVTALWPLWAGLSSPHQASLLVPSALSKLEQPGGLSSCSEASRGPVTAQSPQKQWDFPNGWAPHQMLAWDGLRRYGYGEEAERVCYRWLGMMTRCFRDFGGTVVEKYDVTGGRAPQRVGAEYGNQGVVFEYAPLEGFGWTNASYLYGLSLMSLHAKRALGVGAPYEVYKAAVKKATEAA